MTNPVEPVAEASVEVAVEPPKPAGADLSPEALQAELRRARDDAAKYRTQLRELQPLADKAREAEEAQKTELQKIADRAAAAERERDDLRNEAVRYRLAAKHAIRPDDFDLLGSGTEEEIEARALRLTGLYATQATPAVTPAAVPGRPVEQLHPGATPPGLESEDEKTWNALFGASSH